MPLTAPQILALRAEFDTDPNSYGYAQQIAIGADQTLANMLNHVRDGVTAPPAGNLGAAITGIKRPNISSAELLEAIDIRDFPASPGQVSNAALAAAWFESATQQPFMRLQTDAGVATRVKNNLDRLLGDTQGSQTRLNALAVRNGSRAEQLFGRDTFISANEVAAAFGRV